MLLDDVIECSAFATWKFLLHYFTYFILCMHNSTVTMLSVGFEAFGCVGLKETCYLWDRKHVIFGTYLLSYYFS